MCFRADALAEVAECQCLRRPLHRADHNSLVLLHYWDQDVSAGRAGADAGSARPPVVCVGHHAYSRGSTRDNTSVNMGIKPVTTRAQVKSPLDSFTAKEW